MIRGALLLAVGLAIVGAASVVVRAQALPTGSNLSDFNGDGHTDLLWQEGIAVGRSQARAWLMHGLNRIGDPVSTTPIWEIGYDVVGAADMGSVRVIPPPTVSRTCCGAIQ